jgi:uncharacterized protein YqeY
MSLVEQLNSDIKKAMLAKEKVRLAALRAIKSAFMLESTKEGSSGKLSNEIAQKIIAKLHKQRMDAYSIYVEQNRPDLSKEEFAQAKVLEEYLPEQMSEEELRSALQELITEMGASSLADLGKVMGKAMGLLKAKADGALISKTVKDLLA